MPVHDVRGRIFRRYLLPVLARLLASFPFVELSFHSDNDSKNANCRPAALMEELGLEEFAKLRQRPCNNDP